MHRHHRIEKVSQIDPIRFGSKFEFFAGRIKRPWTARFREREGRLIGPEEHLLLHLPIAGPVVDRQCVLAYRFGRNDTHDLARYNPADGSIFRYVFQS